MHSPLCQSSTCNVLIHETVSSPPKWLLGAFHCPGTHMSALTDAFRSWPDRRSRENEERDTHRQKSMAAVNEVQGHCAPWTNRLREHPFGRSTLRWWQSIWHLLSSDGLCIISFLWLFRVSCYFQAGNNGVLLSADISCVCNVYLKAYFPPEIKIHLLTLKLF